MAIEVQMSPEPGARAVAHVGDHWSCRLQVGGVETATGWRAFLRTDIGRVAAQHQALRRELLGERPEPGQILRDIPMHADGDGAWRLDLALAETGFFIAKAFAVAPDGSMHWPSGDDAAVAVHPAWTRSGNTIYCAFARMFGPTRALRREADALRDDQLAVLDRHGYTVIPPSGTLRDLTAQLDHIFNTLGCRILHLLPINPTPTTHARYGRFGSPYAALDFTAIDPALVVHDRRSTGLEQFRELVDGVHQRDGRVFLDIAINHTGWMSRLQEDHPEWFERQDDGTFVSPGAWGVTWEDLVELDTDFLGLQRHLAEVFRTWCRRGVDGFRCDAGYMIPVAVWRRILAAVHEEFPDAVFLLEGLGGAWEATADLLTQGRMQWAYSELFQNYSAEEIASYLDHAIAAEADTGVLVHYSETHDNDRLAARGRQWSLLRNRVCALTSQQGAFGFTCGVEWLADEKLLVHHSRGLNWGGEDHIVDHLRTLTRLLHDHPCFRDGARRKRVSGRHDPVYALHRQAPDDGPSLLIVVNPHPREERRFAIPSAIQRRLGAEVCDLLAPHATPALRATDQRSELVLAPLQCVCLGRIEDLERGSGETYRQRRACQAAAVAILAATYGCEAVPHSDWRALADVFAADPLAFVAAATRVPAVEWADPARAVAAAADGYAPVLRWHVGQCGRVTPVPAGHHLVVVHGHPFRYRLELPDGRWRHGAGIATAVGHVAVLAPNAVTGAGRVVLESCDPHHPSHRGELAFLPAAPEAVLAGDASSTLLLTNGRGAMARMSADFGAVRSKYDCVLAANLHPQWPVDRHVLVKRVRAWLRCGHFIFPVDGSCLAGCEAGPPARWSFAVPGGEGRHVALEITAWMPSGRNETCLRFRNCEQTGANPPVSLVLRVDIEDRSFHAETVVTPQTEAHFHRHFTARDDGFAFTPASDRQLQVDASGASFHAEEEWCRDIPHPIEGERGQRDRGDAWSPGWFSAPLEPGGECLLRCAATSSTDASADDQPAAPAPPPADWAECLSRGIDAYVVRRDDGWSVIAGYPWFLDWGRDTLICARGLIADGRHEQVAGILRVFGRFEDHGTLPNCIHGGDASNRETSDAALWYGVVVEELIAAAGPDFLDEALADGRSVRAVLRSIAAHHLAGTPTGVRVDAASGLVWSPSHFTWMDTNHPAGTPRRGYPIEIQVLWWRLLRLLAELESEPLPRQPAWSELAERVAHSVGELFWLESAGYWADQLLARPGVPAAAATPDTALRCNALFVPALGLDTGVRARRCVAAAGEHLIVPGAIRSLAPLPVQPPLVIAGPDGAPLIDPQRPYQGHYQGDEDRQRKPAYHNGTAWTWPYPVFCEALLRVHPGDPRARAAVRSYLAASSPMLGAGCLGQLPEICDGDAPHTQRGCDAQAWGMTEALRVWRQVADPAPT